MQVEGRTLMQRVEGRAQVGWAGSWPLQRRSIHERAIAVQTPVHAATDLALIHCMPFPCHDTLPPLTS